MKLKRGLAPRHRLIFEECALSMPDDNQELDASGVGVADMSPEEIDAALAAVASEVGSTSPLSIEPSDLSSSVAAPSADQPPAPAEPPTNNSPTTSEQAAPSDAQDAATAEQDTDAALDRIDSDLAELESLLAQTSSDGTSIPASIAQAPPPPPEPQEPEDTAGEPNESAETQETAESEAGGTTSAEDDASLKQESLEPGSIDDMLLDNGSDALSESPDTPSPASTADEAAVAQEAEEADGITIEPFDGSPLGILRAVVNTVLLKPLIILDKPFVRLGPRVKAMVGLAAAATLLVAVATWVVVCMR